MRRVAAVTAVLIAAGLMAPATAQAQDAPAPSAQLAKPTWKVSADLKAPTVVVGEDAVVVRGRVRPNAAGQRIVLQQRLEKQTSWRKSGAARIKRNGSFKLTDKPSEGGLREYRVVKPGTDGRKKGISRTLSVTVYAWQNLTSGFAGPSAGTYAIPSSIGTRYYPSSLQLATAGTPGYAEYTLGRLCTSLEATYALSDSSETGSTGTVQVTTDGTVRSTTNLVVGTVAEAVLDLKGVYRLRLDLASSAEPKGYTAVGTPRVLCAR